MNALPPDRTSENLVDRTIKTFCARTATSKVHASRNRRALADKTPLAMPFSQRFKEAYYPIVSDKSEGAYLWDVDGNSYVDILMGLGCNILGHNPAPIREAIEERLEKGIQLGPQSEIAGEAATLWAELTGHDRITFTNSGTEAVMTAVRIARAATGRRKIAVFTNSYHGHSDTWLFKAKRLEYLRRGALQRSESGPLKLLRPFLKRTMLTGAKPSFSGISASLGRDVLVLEYGNPRSLDIVRRNKNRLAAVLVEPVQSRMLELQPREFLHELRKITSEAGSALIFDEMISGFRVAQGGAQAHFDVRADIATYGKIAGGGLPLSLIAGTPRFMDHVDGGDWRFGDTSAPAVPTTFFAGTYCRHPLCLTASLAMAKELKSRGPKLQEQLNSETNALVRNMNSALSNGGIPVKFTSFGSFFAVSGSESRMDPNASVLLSLMLLAQGVHMRPGDRGGFLSASHGQRERDFIEGSFTSALAEINAAGLLSRVPE